MNPTTTRATSATKSSTWRSSWRSATPSETVFHARANQLFVSDAPGRTISRQAIRIASGTVTSWISTGNAEDPEMKIASSGRAAGSRAPPKSWMGGRVWATTRLGRSVTKRPITIAATKTTPFHPWWPAIHANMPTTKITTGVASVTHRFQPSSPLGFSGSRSPTAL